MLGARTLLDRIPWRIVVFCGALALQGSIAVGRYSPNRWLFRDGSFYFNTVRGIVENGSLDQSHLHPRSWFNGRLGWNYNLTDDWSNVAVGRDGKWYPKHPLLMPILSVPFYLALGAVGTLAFNVLCGALCALFAAELAAGFAARWAASVLGLAIAAVPHVAQEAYGFNNDLFYSTLVVGAAALLAWRRPGGAGLLAGLAVFAKITNVFFLVPFGLWALFPSRGDEEGAALDTRSAWRFAAGCVPGLAVAAGVNWALFGAPWITAYHRVLVVHAGRQEIEPHTRLFHREFWVGLRAVWGWPAWRDPQGRGILAVFPLYLPALAGAAFLAIRRRFVPALVFALALLWPLFFFAKYDWYRDDFSDPVYFLSAAPLAAFLAPFFPAGGPRPIAPVIWKWGLAAGAALLVALAGARAVRAAQPRPYDLARDIEHAQVFLGEVPCDYFNNQVDRWECSGFDRGQESLMTGVTLDGAPSFGGVRRTMIVMNPHPQRWPRRILFHVPMGRSFTLSYGIPDGSPSGFPVDLDVAIDGKSVARETIESPGLHQLVLPTGPFAGETHVLELTVAGAPTPARGFYFDGTVTG